MSGDAEVAGESAEHRRSRRKRLGFSSKSSASDASSSNGGRSSRHRKSRLDKDIEGDAEASAVAVQVEPTPVSPDTFKGLLARLHKAAAKKKDDVEAATEFSDLLAGSLENGLAVIKDGLQDKDPRMAYLSVGLLDYCVSRWRLPLYRTLATKEWIDVLENCARANEGQQITHRIVAVVSNWDHLATHAGVLQYPSAFLELSDRLTQEYGVEDVGGNSKGVQFKGKCGVCGVKLLFPPNATKAKCGRCNSVVRLPKDFTAKAAQVVNQGFDAEALVGLKVQNEELREKVKKQKSLEEELEQLRLENQRLKSEKEQQEESKLCSICLDNSKDCALVPCGHSFCLTCCTTLVAKKKNCPVCRSKIKQVARVFLDV